MSWEITYRLLACLLCDVSACLHQQLTLCILEKAAAGVLFSLPHAQRSRAAGTTSATHCGKVPGRPLTPTVTFMCALVNMLLPVTGATGTGRRGAGLRGGPGDRRAHVALGAAGRRAGAQRQLLMCTRLLPVHPDRIKRLWETSPFSLQGSALFFVLYLLPVANLATGEYAPHCAAGHGHIVSSCNACTLYSFL